VTTEYADKLGHVVKQGYFLNGTEYIDTFTYDYLGNRLSSLTALDASNGRNYTAKWEYDYANRPVKETNALVQFGHKTHDALGRNTSATNRAGTVTTFTYDALDRLLTQTTPFENVSGTVYSTVKKYDYNPAGNVTREQTQNNVPGQRQGFAKTEYQYDNRDRLVEADNICLQAGRSAI
jgi:YD repeat-containing protein